VKGTYFFFFAVFFAAFFFAAFFFVAIKYSPPFNPHLPDGVNAEH
jgi:hypothetical protein